MSDGKFSIKDVGTIQNFCGIGMAVGLRAPDGRAYSDPMHQAEHVAEFMRIQLAEFDAMKKRIQGETPRIVLPQVSANGLHVVK